MAGVERVYLNVPHSCFSYYLEVKVLASISSENSNHMVLFLVFEALF